MRALKILVVGMGVLIVAGTVTLVALLVQRSTGGGGGDRVASGTLSLRQPAGSRIAGIASAEGRIAVWVERPDGGRILLVDPARGRILGEIVAGD